MFPGFPKWTCRPHHRTGALPARGPFRPYVGIATAMETWGLWPPFTPRGWVVALQPSRVTGQRAGLGPAPAVPSLPPAARRAPPPHTPPSPPQLSMLRISPSMGHSLDAGLALRHLLFLLEYCMVTGYDWWDILLHVQPNMVQSLVEKLHEEYTRQKAELQQVPAPLGCCLVPPSG